MTAAWDYDVVAGLLASVFAPAVRSASGPAAAAPRLDVIITFDAHGVSSHPNHIALYEGAKRFVKSINDAQEGGNGGNGTMQLYTLTSTGVVRKYMAVFDALSTITAFILGEKEGGASPTPLLFISDPSAVFRAQRAMVVAHKSQMKWFRWLWILCSRYMVINDLRREAVE